MKTMERPREEVHARMTPTRARIGWGMAGFIAVLALLLGTLGSWAIFGRDDPTAIAAGGGGLTDRQQEMVEVFEDYRTAWNTNDSARALSVMTPNAFVTFEGTVWSVEDGMLARQIDSGLYDNLTHLEPVLVERNTIASFHRDGGLEAVNVFEFTSSGEVLITQHTIVR